MSWKKSIASVDEARGKDAALAMLRVLAPFLDKVSPSLSAAVEDMFRKPLRYRTAADLSAAARMSTRAVFRRLGEAGLHSPRRLIACARVIRAFELLRNGTCPVREASQRVGYTRTDQFSLHVRVLVGLPPRQAARLLDQQAFVAAAAAALVKASSLCH